MGCMSELGSGTERRRAFGALRFVGPISHVGLLISIATLLAGCQGGIEEGSLPPIPAPNLESMAPEARGMIGQFAVRARENPSDGEASGRFGMALHAYELRQDSIKCYQRAIALAPDHWRWRYYLGTLLAELGRHDEAASQLQTVVAMAPKLVAARIRLGQSLVTIDETDRAMKVFEEALELEPLSAAAHFGLGKALAAAEENQAALSAYIRSLELEPTAGAARYALALLHRGLGQDEEAAEQLALIEDGNRMPPPIYDSLMVALRNLRIDKHRYLSMGIRSEANGDIGKAAAMYEKAVELDPEYLQGRVNLIGAYGKLGRFLDAELQYQAVLRFAPDSEELHVNWGMLQATRERFDDAAASYRRALEINPVSADTHADLGTVLVELGRDAEALRHFSRALQNEPNHRLANFHLARYLVAEDRLAEAIDHLLRTREPVDGRTPTYIYGLSDAYLRSGNVELSLRYAREAAALAGEFGQSELARAIGEDIRRLEAASRR